MSIETQQKETSTAGFRQVSAASACNSTDPAAAPEKEDLPEIRSAFFNSSRNFYGYSIADFRLAQTPGLLLDRATLPDALDAAFSYPNSSFTAGLLANPELPFLLQSENAQLPPDILKRFVDFCSDARRIQTSLGKGLIKHFRSELEPLLLAPVVESLESGCPLGKQPRVLLSNYPFARGEMLQGIIGLAMQEQNATNPACQALAANHTIYSRKNCRLFKRWVEKTARTDLNSEASIIDRSLLEAAAEVSAMQASEEQLDEIPPALEQENDEALSDSYGDDLEAEEESEMPVDQDGRDGADSYDPFVEETSFSSNGAIYDPELIDAGQTAASGNGTHVFAAALLRMLVIHNERFIPLQPNSQPSRDFSGKNYSSLRREEAATLSFAEIHAKAQALLNGEYEIPDPLDELEQEDPEGAADFSLSDAIVQSIRAEVAEQSSEVLQILGLRESYVGDLIINMSIAAEENSRHGIIPKRTGLAIAEEHHETLIRWLFVDDNAALPLSFVVGACSDLVTEENVDRLIALAEIFPNSCYASGLSLNQKIIELRESRLRRGILDSADSDSPFGRGIRKLLHLPVLEPGGEWEAREDREPMDALMQRARSHYFGSRDETIAVEAELSRLSVDDLAKCLEVRLPDKMPPQLQNFRSNIAVASAPLIELLGAKSYEEAGLLAVSGSLPDGIDLKTAIKTLKSAPDSQLLYSAAAHLPIVTAKNWRSWFRFVTENPVSLLSAGLARNAGFLQPKQTAKIAQWLQQPRSDFDRESWLNGPEGPLEPSALTEVILQYPFTNCDTLAGRSLLRTGQFPDLQKAHQQALAARQSNPAKGFRQHPFSALQPFIHADSPLIAEEQALMKMLGIEISGTKTFVKGVAEVHIFSPQYLAEFLVLNPELTDARLFGLLGRCREIVSGETQAALLDLAEAYPNSALAQGLSQNEAISDNCEKRIRDWCLKTGNLDTVWGAQMTKRLLDRNLQAHTMAVKSVRTIKYRYRGTDSTNGSVHETEYLYTAVKMDLMPHELLREALWREDTRQQRLLDRRYVSSIEEFSQQTGLREKMKQHQLEYLLLDLCQHSDAAECSSSHKTLRHRAAYGAARGRLLDFAILWRESALGFALGLHPAVLTAERHDEAIYWMTEHPNDELSVGLALNTCALTDLNIEPLRDWINHYRHTAVGRALQQRINREILTDLPMEVLAYPRTPLHGSVRTRISDILGIPSLREAFQKGDSCAISETQLTALTPLLQQYPNLDLSAVVGSNPNIFQNGNRVEWHRWDITNPNTRLAAATGSNPALFSPVESPQLAVIQWLKAGVNAYTAFAERALPNYESLRLQDQRREAVSGFSFSTRPKEEEGAEQSAEKTAVAALAEEDQSNGQHQENRSGGFVFQSRRK